MGQIVSFAQIVRNLILMCLLVSSFQLAAQTDIPYFQALVPVHSQSASDRKYAAQKGLREVLVRMSGSEDALLNPVVQKAIDRAQSYVEQLQFEVVEEQALIEKGYKQALRVDFSPQLIHRLLVKDAGVRYWPENRPQILVWLVEDNEDLGKHLLNRAAISEDDTVNALVSALDTAARERGLPLEYPLLDLEDQMAISANDVWRLNDETIRAASERYSAPVMLVGRYSTTSRGELWSTWQYLHQDSSQTWDVRSAEPDTLAWEVLAPLNEFLAEKYAIVPGSDTEESALVLRLGGIASFRDYRLALDYLSGLAMISDVGLLQAFDGELLLALKSEASLNRFKTAVELDKKIEFVPAQSELPVWQQLPEGTLANPVHFRWQ